MVMLDVFLVLDFLQGGPFAGEREEDMQYVDFYF